jgi:hypothetical protein
MKTYQDRLTENIEAIGIAHTQMMDILKESIDLENINEDKWKAVADGKGKAQDVADMLLTQLKEKEQELEKLKNPNAKVKEETSSNNSLAQRTR